MKTKYVVRPAHSGTSLSEIDKAKRIYRASVKKGICIPRKSVELRFSDVNYVIRCEVIDLDTFSTVDSFQI